MQDKGIRNFMVTNGISWIFPNLSYRLFIYLCVYITMFFIHYLRFHIILVRFFISFLILNGKNFGIWLWKNEGSKKRTTNENGWMHDGKLPKLSVIRSRSKWKIFSCKLVLVLSFSSSFGLSLAQWSYTQAMPIFMTQTFLEFLKQIWW